MDEYSVHRLPYNLFVQISTNPGQPQLLSTSTISKVMSCKLSLIDKFEHYILTAVSCRSGLPKKTQLYTFFEIVDVAKFRHHLVHFIPLVKTVSGVLKDRKAIDDHKKNKHHGLVHIFGVNISISHKGFVKVRKNESNNAEVIVYQKKKLPLILDGDR